MEMNCYTRRASGLLSHFLVPFLLHAGVVCVDDSSLGAMQDGSAQYPYRNVQSAIANAASHDTILVAIGAYGRIENMGASFVILGGYAGGTPAEYQAGTGGDFANAVSDPSLTVISGGPDSIGVNLTRFDYEPFSFVLRNVTVNNSFKGIVCDQLVSWPRVEHMRIVDCIIEDNGQPGETSLGAGILVSGNGHQLLNNIIRDNHGGRGPAISSNMDIGDSLLVQGNRIENNRGYDDHCGGVYLGGYAVLRDNVIAGNQLLNSYGWGGGVLILGTAYMSGNVIRNNHAPSYGGAVFVDEGGVLYMNNELIHDNTTGLEGAAVAADNGDPGSSYVYLTSCTIANNRSSDGGLGGNALFLDVSSFGTVTDCILNGNGNGDDFHVTTGSVLTVSYTLSQESVAGAGNFTADPLFADTANGDFRLKSIAGRYDPGMQAWVTDAVHSPAIDAGDPSAPYANEPTPHGDRVNLGFDGNTAYASKSSTNTGIVHVTEEVSSMTAFPNPAMNAMTVAVPMASGSSCTLRIFNELGVEVLMQRTSQATTQLDVSQLADGTYVLMATCDGETQRKKFVVNQGD